MCVHNTEWFHLPEVLQTNHEILIFDQKEEIRKLLVLARKQKEQRPRPAVKNHGGTDFTSSKDVSLPPPVRFHRRCRGHTPSV